MIARKLAKALQAARSLAEGAKLMVQTLEGRIDRAPSLALELLEYDVAVAEQRVRDIRAFADVLGLALSPTDLESLRQAAESLHCPATEGYPDASGPEGR